MFGDFQTANITAKIRNLSYFSPADFGPVICFIFQKYQDVTLGENEILPITNSFLPLGRVFVVYWQGTTIWPCHSQWSLYLIRTLLYISTVQY